MAELENRKPFETEKQISYYSEFKFFCSFYSNREKHLAQSVLSSINLPSQFLEPYRILDVGSSDGLLLQTVFDMMSAQIDLCFETIAIEPDKEAFISLIDRFSRPVERINKCFNVNPTNSDLEIFMKQKEFDPIKHDIILCSHVFYHFDPAKWGDIITYFRGHLTETGNIIVILDSFDSPIYSLKQDTNRFFYDIENDFFGKEILAEDFLYFLKHNDIHHIMKPLRSFLFLPQQDLDVIIFRILCFLFRHGILHDELSERTITDKIQTYSERGSQLYMIPWTEKLFVIGKT